MKHNDHSRLLRRLTAAAAGAAMLLSLTACTKAPAETTRPSEPVIPEFSVTVPQTQPETQAIQPLETTAPKLEINYENLVTDACAEVVVDDYGYEYCYHIPQVNLESAVSLNRDISQTLTAIVERDLYEPLLEYGYSSLYRMCYVWGHRDDVVSILVEAVDADSGLASYYPYYLSAQTGTAVSRAELLGAFGLSEQDFYDHIYENLKAYWDDMRDSLGYEENASMKEVYDQMAADTLSNENVYASIPFIYKDGRLACAATIYVPAGGGFYLDIFDYETGEALEYLVCTTDHPAASGITLEYFIENCDRRYFTRADIQDFDEQMCLYARNAIFAKSGWSFSSQELADYFRGYTWYTPTYTADEFSDDLLNKYQLANRDLILAYENGQ